MYLQVTQVTDRKHILVPAEGLTVFRRTSVSQVGCVISVTGAAINDHTVQEDYPTIIKMLNKAGEFQSQINRGETAPNVVTLDHI